MVIHSGGMGGGGGREGRGQGVPGPPHGHRAWPRRRCGWQHHAIAPRRAGFSWCAALRRPAQSRQKKHPHPLEKRAGRAAFEGGVARKTQNHTTSIYGVLNGRIGIALHICRTSYSYAHANNRQPCSTHLALNMATSFTPLASEQRDAIPTREAAVHLNRSQQTLRIWALKEHPPIRPVRVNGRLAWKVADIRRVLEVGE